VGEARRSVRAKDILQPVGAAACQLVSKVCERGMLRALQMRSDGNSKAARVAKRAFPKGEGGTENNSSLSEILDIGNRRGQTGSVV